MIKDFLRATIGIGGRRLGPLLRRVDRSLTIFLLHDVDDEPAPFTLENDIWVSTERFKFQMEFVAANFNVISMEEMLGGDIPKRAAMITFDDGYAGTFKHALPTLGGMGLPATVFVNMSPVYGENYWAEKVFYLCDKVPQFLHFLEERVGAGVKHPQLQCTQELVESYEREHGEDYLIGLQSYISPYASSEDLREADENPLVTLGSHLYTHYNVRNLSDQVLDEQYHKNATALSQFKSYLPIFAFPFGHPDACFSTHQASALLGSGALRLFTSWPRPNSNCASKVLDRVALLQRHDRDSRLWFQVLRSPLLEIVGRARLPGDYRLDGPFG